MKDDEEAEDGSYVLTSKKWSSRGSIEMSKVDGSEEPDWWAGNTSGLSSPKMLSLQPRHQWRFECCCSRR